MSKLAKRMWRTTTCMTVWLAAAHAASSAAQSTPQSAAVPPGALDSGKDDPVIIVVTAQKREERLLDVPQSVSVISGADLEAVHAQRFADYFTRVPSANIVESQAGQTRLVLRGINTGGAGATVATYVDETPYGSTTSLANGSVLTPDFDPFDLTRVEVLRGPQGTLYGANSLGGLVKYVTTLPKTDAFHAAAETGIEDVRHGNTCWSGRAAVNVPLAGTVAVRASGFYRKDPGFIDDPVRGSDVNDGKTYGGRGQILVRPSDALSLRASVFAQNLDSNGSNTYDADPVTLRPTLGRLSQRRIPGEPNNIRYRVYNLTGDYDFGPVELLSSTSLGTLKQRGRQDASNIEVAPAFPISQFLSSNFGTPLGAAIEQHVDQRRFTQEVRLASSGRQAFDWTIGGYFSKESNLIDQSLDAVNDPGTDTVADLAGLQTAVLDSDYRELAGFASGTYHFSPRFDLTVGARYSGNRQRSEQTTGGGFVGPDTSLSGQSSDKVFTYAVAPAFKPNQSTTIYARLARGYRPGGPNIISPGAPDSVPSQFGADTTTNYEVGVKSELLDRRLTLELSGFWINWKNIQLLVAVDGFNVNTNAGSARSRGIEFSAAARPARGLTFEVNGAYVDAVLTSDGSPFSGGADGDRLPYNPRFAGTLSAEYQRPLSGAINGTAGISWRYIGSRRSGFDAARPQVSLDPFSQIDAHAGVTIDRFKIDAFVRNITDSRGVVDVGGFASAANGAIAVGLIRPRSFGLSLGVRY